MGVPDLLNTAKSWLTTSTKLLGPTAPLESGGAELTEYGPAGPLKPWPTPSKPTPSAGADAEPGVDWTTGSAALALGTGSPFFGSFSFCLSGSGTAAGARSRSGGDLSWFTLS